MEQQKLIKDIFTDFKIESNLLNAQIKNIKLTKKTNKVEIDLISDSFISIKDILIFEKYIKQKFQIENIDICIEYNDVEIPSLEEQWDMIRKYLGYVYPVSKPILETSNIEIDNKNLNVMLDVKGAEFLEARGFEKILETLLKNYYNANYRVKYIERLSQEKLEKYESRAKLAEKLAIELAQAEANLEPENDNVGAGAVSDHENEQPIADGVGAGPVSAHQNEASPEKQPEKTNLILR